ncbi:MAG: hypothetical protein ACP5N9_03520 [Candidatus Bilamarchaeum sp.]
MTRRLYSTYVSGGAAVAMVAVLAVGAIQRSCNKPAPDRIAPVSAPAPAKNDNICDIRFGEENPRSPNFDLTSCGYCGDGVQQIASKTPNSRTTSPRPGLITNDGQSRSADQQVTSFASRSENTTGMPTTVGGVVYRSDFCPIDTALRGNGVCDSNVGEHEQNPTFVYGGFARVSAELHPVSSSELSTSREGSEIYVVRIPVDESARYLDAQGMPVRATSMPRGGRENPFYAPQDCPPPAPRTVVTRPVIQAPRPATPSIQSCRTVLGAEVLNGINIRAEPVFSAQRETWLQGANEDRPTYTVSCRISSGSSGSMSASNCRCSGPSTCSPDQSAFNTRLSTLTGTPNVNCSWSGRY